MKLLMTGGTGDVGTAAVKRLAEQGHDVLVIGRTGGVSIPGARYEQCDIAEYARLRELVEGCDAIVHLAAIRAPMLAPAEEVFRVNCAGTFNVYRAAEECGITRVVSASSINAVGYFFGAVEWELSYLPVDESHPTHTTDAYSYSKQVDELTADYYWRRSGISGAMLRLPAVLVPDDRYDERMTEYIGSTRARVLDIASLSPEALRDWRESAAAAVRELRAAKGMEQRDGPKRRGIPGMELFGQKYNMFTAVDARDSAHAIELALTADYAGSHPLFINDTHNTAGLPSAMIAELFYPKVELRDAALETERYGPTASLVSIARARDLIGYEPEYSIERYYP
ncbi:MAG: NAD(P)-dependent oxidoreductase [Spirochaetaceae bacterium]|nr:MAG: NAD(P)-dependent oxidoreductase [Spirochaetaceae bacterium]